MKILSGQVKQVIFVIDIDGVFCDVVAELDHRGIPMEIVKITDKVGNPMSLGKENEENILNIIGLAGYDAYN